MIIFLVSQQPKTKLTPVERRAWSNPAMSQAYFFRCLWPAQLRTRPPKYTLFIFRRPCLEPLLGCELRSLFCVSVAQAVLQVSLASAHLRHFRKAEWAGISPSCRRKLKAPGLLLSVRRNCQSCSAFMALRWSGLAHLHLSNKSPQGQRSRINLQVV